jgi:hypothetical protein
VLLISDCHFRKANFRSCVAGKRKGQGPRAVCLHGGCTGSDSAADLCGQPLALQSFISPKDGESRNDTA